jgi:Sulfotransferase family
MATVNDPVVVLCITGWCRNGSTIIGNILNEIPGFMHVGELHFLWKNSAGLGVNSKCGCGQVLTECPFWSVVLENSLPAGMSPGDFAAEVARRQRACVRTRHTWRRLRRGADDADARAHAELMGRTYAEIAARSGAQVIVDTSKIPGEAALLPFIDGVAPLFVHLVRDPRAVAESWREPKQYVYAMSASKSTWYWYGFNLATRAITRRYPDRSLFLRHEDFLADPAGTIDRLLTLVSADRAANPVSGRLIELHANHTVTGNPDRFLTGPTVLRAADDRWKTSLSRRAKLAAAVGAWPLFWRYGYRYRGTLAPPPLRPASLPVEDH